MKIFNRLVYMVILNGMGVFFHYAQAEGASTVDPESEAPKKMYQDSIHPADQLLIDMFGRRFKMEPLDFSKIQEATVCEDQYCKKNTTQSECYRGFVGDVNRPRNGCTGYQRDALKRQISDWKKAVKAKKRASSEPSGLSDLSSQAATAVHPETTQGLLPHSVDVTSTLGSRTDSSSSLGSQQLYPDPRDAGKSQDNSAAFMGVAGVGGMAALAGMGLAHSLDDGEDHVPPSLQETQRPRVRGAGVPAGVGGVAAAVVPGAAVAGGVDGLPLMPPAPVPYVDENFHQDGAVRDEKPDDAISVMLENIVNELNIEIRKLSEYLDAQLMLSLLTDKIIADVNFARYHKNHSTAQSLIFLLRGQLKLMRAHENLNFVSPKLYDKIINFTYNVESSLGFKKQK